MGIPKVSSDKKVLKALETTKAYVEYKIRYSDDLDIDMSNWSNNISRFIALTKNKK